jgi:hypothetical protein
MGYTITIGEAELESEWPAEGNEYGDDEPSVSWAAKGAAHPEAPYSSDITGNSNSRSPGYGVWADFCRALGLYEWMLNKDTGKMRRHPGCFALTTADAAIVTACVVKYREAHPKAEACFCPCPDCSAPWRKDEPGVDAPPHNPNADGNLMRATWLEWWVRWAVTNCARPCISNS